MKDIGHFSLVRVNDNIVELTRQNMFGEEASRCFEAKWNEFVPNFQKWMRDEMLIQDAFPDFSADDREFIVSGLTPDAWDKIFGEPEEVDTELSEEPGH